MDEHFELLHDRLKLTKKQQEDVRRKYSGVSKSLYEEFYEGEYDEKTRLIIGSHGKKTETRYPVGDIDLIFKISRADLEKYQAYQSNGPSALLSRAREKLQKTYTTSEIKSWGKVVLVEFSDGQHNVEVLPCYEKEDKTFIIPDTENGGSWGTFDPRAEMKIIRDSNNQTELTRKLIKFIKRWRTKANAPIKSYQIEFFCVNYLDNHYEQGTDWTELIEGFFTWLELQAADLSKDALSRVGSAKSKAQKARDYELNNKPEEACIQWRKIFGTAFPVYDENLSTINQLENKYLSEENEYIHERYQVKIDRKISMQILPKIRRHGFREFILFGEYLKDGIRFLPKSASLVFKVRSSLGVTANYLWKIRNLSQEAADKNDLRGAIIKGQGQLTREEGTRYKGTHYIECYAIKAGVCVATARLFVPIGEYDDNQ